MHADELHVDAALVRRLLSAQFPEWSALRLERVRSGGTVNALFRLGGDMVVRLPLVERAADGVAHEHEWLPRLAPLLPVAVPTVLGKGSSGEGYPCPWSVFRWIDGTTPPPGDGSGALAEDLAAFVGALRRIDQAGAPPAYRGGPLAELDDPLRAAVDQLHGMIDTSAAVVAWEAALEAPGWTGPPVWSHSDLLPGNLLAADGRLAGVLDFAASGVGDPACDLMPAWSVLPAGARSAFRAVLDVDDATWARGRGWSLAQALIALPYYHVSNPVMAANARYAIGEVLGETS